MSALNRNSLGGEIMNETIEKRFVKGAYMTGDAKAWSEKAGIEAADSASATLRNNDETVKSGFRTGAGLVITVVFVAALMAAFFIAKPLISKSSEQFNSLMGGYTELGMTMYDGNVVSGSQVISMIDEMSDNANVTVEVQTKATARNASQTFTSYVDKKYKENNPAVTRDSAEYINENGKFTCSVITNDNGMVTKVVFIQQ